MQMERSGGVPEPGAQVSVVRHTDHPAEGRSRRGGRGSLAESQGATSYLQPVDVAKMHELLRLKTKAKFVTGGAATGRSLHPGKVSTLGSRGTADYSADGMLMGSMATVGWEEDSWVARWKGVVCRMKHNGDSMKIAKLKPGDVLTVGSSDFTLVVD